MDTLSLLVRNPRWWMTPLLAGLFLLMATSARAQTPQPSLPQPTSARVELFSPQGTAKNTRQVTARFSEPMVTFGDPRGPEPFTITCPALGRAHWADPQNWVYDFDRDLPGGVECRFVLKPDLKTLAGNSLSATAAFVFNTGGPRIIQSFPDTYQPIDAQQIFVLTLDAEADPDTIRDRVRCVVAGQPEPLRIKLLTGQERAKVLAFLEKKDSPETVVVQCDGTLPPETKVKLSWGAEIRAASGIVTDKDQLLEFLVRPAFTVRVECPDGSANSCDPGSIKVRFSTRVAAERIAALRLRGPDRVYAPATIDPEQTPFVEEVWFNGPFPEKTTLTVELPPDLTDQSGRPLANVRELPLTITTGQPARSPLVRFAGGDIVESLAGGVLPVVLRDVEREIRGRWLAIGASPDPATGQRPDPDQRDQRILQWLRRLSPTKPVAEESWFDQDTPTHPFTLANSGRSRLEVAGIPLVEPGFYVVELENPGFGTGQSDSRFRYLTTAALVTNLGVQFKNGDEGPFLVWVTALDNAQPVAGATVIVRDACDGKPLGQSRTGEDGVTRITDPLPPRSGDAACALSGLFVSAHTDNDSAFVLVSSPRHAPSTPDPLAHTILDRTLFRAGETVSMKHVLRRQTLAGFAISQEGQPKTLKITHGDSDQSYELPLRWDRHGIAETAWTIPKDAKLGRYYMELDTLYSESGEFEVAEFRAPTMTARIDPLAKPITSADQAEIAVAIRYFAGGPATHWPIDLRAAVRERYDIDRPKGYERFLFDGADPEKDLVPSLCQPDRINDALPTLRAALNGQGEARVPLPKLPKVREPHDLAVELDYQDPNGERLSAAKTFPLWPADIRLGLKIEPWNRGDPLRFTVVALDLAGQPVADQPVTVELFQRKHVWGHQYLSHGLYHDHHENRIERLGEICASQTDNQGLLRCESRRLDSAGVPAGWNSAFILRARTRDQRNNAAIASAHIPFTPRTLDQFLGNLDLEKLERSAATPFAREVMEKVRRVFRMIKRDEIEYTAAPLEIEPDQENYEPGETARLQMRLPFAEATALVTVEREGVMEHWVTRLAGPTPTLTLPIRDQHAPNVFVSVLAVRGRQRDANPPTEFGDPGKPAFAFGSVPLQVHPTPYRLNVQVIPERQVYAVRERVPVKIKISRADGQPPSDAEVALVAVDEALLELLPNNSWNLLEAMTTNRSHGVSTATTLGRIVGQRHYGPVASVTDLYPDQVYRKLEEKLNRMFKKSMYGGSDGRSGGESSGSIRERFDNLLLWRGRVKLDTRGEGQVTVPLNDSLSSFRIVAVATAGTGHFGTGQATVRTSQDLTLYAGLPPVVREGDQFDAVFTARNASAQPLTLAASARVAAEPGNPALPAFPERNLTLVPGEAREIAWRITVPLDVETLSWEVAAREVRGKALDRLWVQQKVTPVLPVRTYQATLAQLDRPFTLDVERPADALPGRGGVSVTLRAKLGDGLSGVTEYMKQYPYSCLEQQVSVAVALRDRARWDAIMKRLADYTDNDSGLLKYFPGGNPRGSEALTAYILAIAHEAGWPLPEGSLSTLTEGLRKTVKGEQPPSFGLRAADQTPRRLAAVEALSRYDQATPDLLASINFAPEFWPTSALLDWIGILKRMPSVPDREAKLRQAQRMLRARLNVRGEALIFSTERDDGLWWLMVSADLNAVRTILTLLDEPEWREEMPRLVRGAVGRQRRGHWDTTTANAWGRLTLERFSAAFEAQPVAGRTEARLGDQVRAHSWRAETPPAALDFAWPASRQPLTVNHQGTGRPWALIQSRAAIPLKEPLFAGYAIQRTVIPVEQRQPRVWSRGDVARVRLDIDAQADMAWVVVDDPVPTGASILGMGFGGDSRILTSGEQSTGQAWLAFEERRFDRFRAYYELAPKGRWTVEYTVRFNNAGHFELPPTRIEALYLPEMFGEWPNAAVDVRE